MFPESKLLDKVNTYIADLQFTRSPKSLYAPVEYILSLGGKRIRPLLLLMAYNLYKEDVDRVLPQAVALEVYHNFTLLHDDLMDNADMRRNKPTVHKVWNANTAILSGDAMLILSYNFLADGVAEQLPGILDMFNNVSLEICEGQQYDMDFESRMDVAEEEYLNMIRLKTAVLLATGLRMGAFLGGASEDDTTYLYDFGIQIGLAFQLKDDFLDVYGDPKVFGKNLGGDILCNKKTYMLIKALECAQGADKEELVQWMSKKDFSAEEKIAAVTDIYNRIGVKELCEKKMKWHYEKGMESLSKITVPAQRREELRLFAERLMYREL